MSAKLSDSSGTPLAQKSIDLSSNFTRGQLVSLKDFCKCSDVALPALLSITETYKSFTETYTLTRGQLLVALEKRRVDVVGCRDPSTGKVYDIPVDEEIEVIPDLYSSTKGLDNIKASDLVRMICLPPVVRVKNAFEDKSGYQVDADTLLFPTKCSKQGELVATIQTATGDHKKVYIGSHTPAKFSTERSEITLQLRQAVRSIKLPFCATLMTAGSFDVCLTHLKIEKLFKADALLGMMNKEDGNLIGNYFTRSTIPSTFGLRVAVMETRQKVVLENLFKFTTMAFRESEKAIVTPEAQKNPIKVPSSRPHNKTKNLKIGKSSSPPWKRDPTPVGCQKQSSCSSLECTQVSPGSAKKHPIRSRVLPKLPFEECKTSSISNCLQVSSSASELDTVSLVYEKMADYEPISDSDSTCKDVPTLVSTQSSYRHLNSSDGLKNLEKPEDARSVEYDSLDSQSEHEDDFYEYVTPATVDSLLVNIQAVTPLSGHNPSKNIQMHHMHMNDRTTLFKASSIPKDVTTQLEPHLSSKPRIGSTTPADHAKTTGTPKTGYATMMDLEHPKDPELAANGTSPPWPGVIKGQDCSWEKLEEVYDLPEYSAIKQSEDVKNHECSSVVSEEMEDEYEYASHLPSETTGDKFENDSASADCDIHSNYDSDYEDMDELFKTNNIAKLRSLGIQDVQNLLEAIALSQYKETFKEEQVDGKLLVCLNDTMLCELGVGETTHRMELLKLIQGERSVTL